MPIERKGLRLDRCSGTRYKRVEMQHDQINGAPRPLAKSGTRYLCEPPPPGAFSFGAALVGCRDCVARLGATQVF